MEKKLNDEEIIEDFCKHYCIVCKKRIAVFCGTPIVHVAGCCVGIEHDAKKTFYMRTLKAHIWCYEDCVAVKKSKQKKLKTPEWKLRWKFDDVCKVVKRK
jgi:hypothetical protein